MGCIVFTENQTNTKKFAARYAYQTTRYVGQYNRPLHQQGAELPAMRTSPAAFYSRITRYAYSFIDYQGAPPFLANRPQMVSLGRPAKPASLSKFLHTLAQPAQRLQHLAKFQYTPANQILSDRS